MIRAALALVTIPLAARLRRPGSIAIRFLAAAFVGWVAVRHLPTEGVSAEPAIWFGEAISTRTDLMMAVALTTLVAAPLAPLLGGVAMPRRGGSPLDLVPLGRLARVPLRFVAATVVLILLLLSFLPFLSVIAWLGFSGAETMLLTLGFVALTACALAAITILFEQVLPRPVYAVAATLFATVVFLLNSDDGGYPWLALQSLLDRDLDGLVLLTSRWSGPSLYVTPQVDLRTTVAWTLGVTLVALVIADLLAGRGRGPRERGPSWSARIALAAEIRSGARTRPWSRFPLLWLELKRSRPVFGLTLSRLYVGAIAVWLMVHALLSLDRRESSFSAGETTKLVWALMIVLLALAWAASRARVAAAELDHMRVMPLGLSDRLAGLYGPPLAMCGIPLVLALTQTTVDIGARDLDLGRGLLTLAALTLAAAAAAVGFTSVAILVSSRRRLWAALIVLALLVPVLGWFLIGASLSELDSGSLLALFQWLAYYGGVAALAALFVLSPRFATSAGAA